MKLSKESIEILKNFGQINSNAWFIAGNTQKTMAPAKTSVVVATLPDAFDDEFGIYDMREFLNVLGMFASPELTFENGVLSISENSVNVKYRTTDKALLSDYPNTVKFPQTDFTFNVTQTLKNSIDKAAKTLGLNEVAFVSKDGKFVANVYDKTTPSSNIFTVELADKFEEDFSVVFNLDNMKMIDGDYSVEVSKKKITKWVNNNGSYVMFLGIEPSSEFSQ